MVRYPPKRIITTPMMPTNLTSCPKMRNEQIYAQTAQKADPMNQPAKKEGAMMKLLKKAYWVTRVRGKAVKTAVHGLSCIGFSLKKEPEIAENIAPMNV